MPEIFSGKFYFRRFKNSVSEIRKAAKIPLIFNHLNWNPSKCINTEGSYSCQCNTGYKPSGLGWVPIYINEIFHRILRTSENTKSDCVDINECENQTCGANATCQNYPGTHRCFCKSGYEQISSNPFQCQDKGEFEMKTL